MSNSASDYEAWPNLRQRIADLVASGRTDAIEALLSEHPDLRSQEQLLLDCIYAEFCFREERDQQPQPAEYLKRFPVYAKQLQALFEVHEALDTPGLLDSVAGSKQQSLDDAPALRPTELAKPSATTQHESSRRIGPYKLLQIIGEGGMGAVYMADQLEPVKRRVALKLIKSGMDSKHVVARFEAERQALAMMDHQNIAKVLDAGITEDGTPYFAMELVQGMPITKYCDREKLSIPDRLKLFVQVCRALQHAHQKGVIHRDIKPTNVLVTQRDGVPVAKVIDFGLAKAMQTELRLTDKTLFTEVGQVCGTLEYMSPEQAEMNELGLDTRTDVYSLGVLLYELLTGSTPLGQDRIRKEAFHRVLQLILTEEAPRPSRRLSDSGEAITGISEQRRIEPRRLSGILKRELDWIALKALEKDRNRRYDGAGTLADDVQRYLNCEAIIARPPSLSYRLRKVVRRHQIAFFWGISGAILFLSTTFVTLSIAVYAYAQAQSFQELQQAYGDLETAKTDADKASTEADRAKEAAEIALNVATAAKADAMTAKIDADKALAEAATASGEATVAKAEAEMAKAEKKKAEAEVETARIKAEAALGEATAAKAEAVTALGKMQEYEAEGFATQIRAAAELSEFDRVIRIAEEALSKAETNPKIKQIATVLRKQIESAERDLKNAKIPIPDAPNSASISADGSTVVVYSGLTSSVSVFRNVGELHGKRAEPLRIPVTLNGSVKVAVSGDGTCIGLAAASEKQLWQLENDHYRQLPFNDTAAGDEARVSIGWIFCSPAGEHFYAIGNDRDATVEIYSVIPGSSKLLLPPQRLSGARNAAGNFKIRDIVLLPDESALIVQFENQPCYEYRIVWSEDGTPEFDQDRLSRNAPQLDELRILELLQVSGSPEKLFVSPDGQRLGLAFSDTVVFLPRVAIKDLDPDQFSFDTPDRSSSFETLRATFPVEDVQFSKSGNPSRVATGHGKSFLELWDLRGRKYEPCDAKGLFPHSPTGGGFAKCLGGHSDVVKAYTFANGDADRLMSVSADKSIRMSQISTFSRLAGHIMRIRDSFEVESVTPPATIPELNSK